MLHYITLFLLLTLFYIVSAIKDPREYEKILKGKALVVGTLQNPPYSSFKLVDGNLTDMDGYAYHITAYLAEKYQLSISFVDSIDGAFGAIKNGSWNGLVGMLCRGEIDLAATGLSVTYKRSLVVDFCVPYMDEPASLMIPYPELDSTIGGISKPFQYEVWIYIIASLFVCALFLWIISVIESKWKRNRSTRFTTNFWFLFSVLVNPNDCILKTLAAKLIGAAWCLVAIVLVNSYTSSLSSYLMAPRYRPLANSIEEVAAFPRPTLMVLKDTSYESFLLEAKSGIYQKLGNFLREYPELAVPSFEKAIDYVATYKRAYTTEQSVLLAMMEADLKSCGACRVYLAKNGWLNARQTYALPKSSPLIPILNREINWLRQVGLLDHYQRATWPKTNRCSAPLVMKKPSNTVMTVNYLSSAFLLYGFGVLLSIAVFILERFVSCFKKHKRIKRTV